ncbi:hypothetical protein P43SY_003947 [Pythium insidiosum]|uniref:Tail specific protease domain-containing protein n=1 Tax=Pythium insidiosum TaxID=114742 RepID=A0AAD5LII3_PYTIN|nr:hypothetical protein P43SY_003947 [Pythium insidiosum]
MATAASSPAAGMGWRVLANTKLAVLSTVFFFPSLWGTTPFHLLEALVLWPLEVYESLAIVPVTFLRRHMPIVGGTLVVLMTLHGILLRLFLDAMHSIFARITYSRDVVLNYRTFWMAMRDRYAFFETRQADWGVVHQLFGEPLETTTNEDDLWIALQESIALCDDPALSVSRRGPGGSTLTAYGRGLATAARLRFEHAAMDVMQRRHLTDGGRRIAKHFVYGVLNAETSPGWRIGYIALNSMEGFVDFPLPRLDALVPSWTQSDAAPTSTTQTIKTGAQRVVVPEIYDLESMRWALEAILRSLGDVDGLVLDLRFNPGGGSLVSALAVASFFAGPKRSVAFFTDEKLPSPVNTVQRFSRRRRYTIPQSARQYRYQGPLVLLQSQHTRGTAEVLSMALMTRPHTFRIGSATAGSLSQTRKLRLPNFWQVEIPYLRCFSAKGELYEGKGVPADKAIANMEDAVLQHARATAGTSTGEATSEESPNEVFDLCIKQAIEHIMRV